MKLLYHFYKSTIGKKIVMALSGFALFAFVFGHMLGNLKIFLGMDGKSGMYKLDHYAELLRTIGSDFLGRGTVLCGVRIGLSVCLLLHVISAVQLWFLNRKARPLGYRRSGHSSSTPASRAMFYGGLFLAFFIVFHILHFTTGQVHVYGFAEGEVYSNVFRAFEHKELVILYVAAVFFLALHILHGVWSLFQTLGLDTPFLNPGLRVFAKFMALAIFIGFACVPVAVYMGLLPAPQNIYALQTVLQLPGE